MKKVMDNIIIEEAPFVPLFYDEVMHFTNRRVQNWKCNSLNLIELKEVKLEE
jgi:peptide/nickel transport system substrate-binding protein